MGSESLSDRSNQARERGESSAALPPVSPSDLVSAAPLPEGMAAKNFLGELAWKFLRVRAAKPKAQDDEIPVCNDLRKIENRLRLPYQKMNMIYAQKQMRFSTFHAKMFKKYCQVAGLSF